MIKLTILVALIFVITVIRAQQGQNQTSAGPCEEVSDPCPVGQKYADPVECGQYFECSDQGLITQVCEEGLFFDKTLLECGEDDSQCAPPCEEAAGKEEAEGKSPVDEMPPENVLPDGKEDPPQADVNETIFTIPVVPVEKVSTLPVDELLTTQAEKELPVTTTTEVTPEITTTMTVSTTTSTLMPPIEIGTSDPPYTVYVTVTRPKSTTANITATASSNTTESADEVKSGGLSPIMIAIIATVGAAFIVLVVIIILVIICIVKRRRRRKHEIVQMENPRYVKEGNGPRDYRFSRDSSLLVQNRKPRNNNLIYNPNLAAKKKRPPPPVPESKDTPTKRHAPPPPNPFTGEVEGSPYNKHKMEDLYEKDSETSSSKESVEMTTFAAPTLHPNEPPSAEEEEDQTQGGEPTPKEQEEEEEGERSELEEEPTRNGHIPIQEMSIPEEEEDEEEEQEEGEKKEEEEEEDEEKKGLLEDVDEDTMSVDSYDRLNNPFFN